MNMLGHVMVPIDPTAIMLAAAAHPDAAAIWAAMLAARPSVEAGMVATLPARGVNRRNPKFWSDPDVRSLVIDHHRQMTIEQLRDLIRDRVGPTRVPSKSSIDRAWQRLDRTSVKPGSFTFRKVR